MLKIRKSQLEVFKKDAERRFPAHLCKQMRQRCPKATANLDDVTLTKRVKLGIQRAHDHGIQQVDSILVFVMLMLTVAPNFYALNPFASILKRHDLTEKERILRLLRTPTGTDWGKARAASDSLYWRAPRPPGTGTE
jgi:hypothetical protein